MMDKNQCNGKCMTTEELRKVLGNWVIHNVEVPSDIASLVIAIILVVLTWIVLNWIIRLIIHFTWPIFLFVLFFYVFPTFSDLPEKFKELGPFLQNLLHALMFHMSAMISYVMNGSTDHAIS